MGYSTDFLGKLQLTGDITNELFNYINQFADTRRMKRDVDLLNEIYKGEFSLMVIME